MAPQDGLQGPTGPESLQEQEISFSASHLLNKLNAFMKTKELTSLAFKKSNRGEIKQRQKFLLTEKPRVISHGCTIDLGVYKNSPDGVDGIRGNNTETSTVNYLAWLFDKNYPKRWSFVETKLAARAQREANTSERENRIGPSRQHAERIVLQKHKIAAEVAELKQRKIELANIGGIESSAMDIIEKKIKDLERVVLETDEAERNIPQEEERTMNLFFVVTLDGNKVVYNEQAEQLHASAQEARAALVNIRERTTQGEISAQIIIDERIEQKKEEIKLTDAYKATVKKIQAQGFSHDQAEKIAMQQAEKAATTLAVREFTYNMSHGHTYGFSESIVQKIIMLDSVKTFNELFEKVIIDRYEDITDLNHLDRELPLPLDPYFKIVSEVTLYENRQIENYLFDSPASNPLEVYQSTNRSVEARKHLISLTGQKKEPSQGTKEKLDKIDKDDENIDQLRNDLNTYTSKRMRQLLLYQHFRILKNMFQQIDSEGTKLQTSCDFSFDKVTLDPSTHSMNLPFSYQNASTLLQINGTSGQVTIPTLLDRFLGKPSFPTLADATAQKTIEKKLGEAAKLTNEELMLCTSRAEIEEMITAKMSKELLKLTTSETPPEKIATTIEHEALLANLRGYMDNTHELKQSTSTNNYVNIKNNGFRTFISDLVCQGNGKEPLTLEQTKKINTQLQKEEMKNLFAKLTGQVTGFEEFFTDFGILAIVYEERPNNVIKFFDALDKMANSGVNTNEEEGLEKIQELIPKKPPYIGIEESGSTYIYSDRQIKKRTL